MTNSRKSISVEEEKNNNTSNPPNDFLCPISLELFHDPVVNVIGQTYERSAIEQWFRNHSSDPLTGEELTSKLLIPNIRLKSMIESWKTEHHWKEEKTSTLIESNPVSSENTILIRDIPGIKKINETILKIATLAQESKSNFLGDPQQAIQLACLELKNDSTIDMNSELNPLELVFTKKCSSDQTELNQKLLKSVFVGDIENVMILLTQGADKNTKLHFGPHPLCRNISALTLATMMHLHDPAVYKQIMHTLLEAGADFNTDPQVLSPLLYANHSGDYEAMRLINSFKFFKRADEEKSKYKVTNVLYDLSAQAYHLGTKALAFFKPNRPVPAGSEVKEVKPTF